MSHAVDDISFTIKKGETLGVIGESSCGKSTLPNPVWEKGVQLCAHYGELYLDDEAFPPACQAEQYGMTAYVHHTPVPVDCGALPDYTNLRRSYGRCVDQTTTVSRELFSGVLEKYPNVRMVHSMLGADSSPS